MTTALDSLTPGTLLDRFFHYFNQHKVEYCVMNNYESLPHVITSDVDIVVSHSFFPQLDYYLMLFAEQSGVGIVQKLWHGFNKCAYILSPTNSNAFRLQLDFFCDYTAKGFYRVIPSAVILSRRVSFHTFYIPDSYTEFLFLLCRRIIKGDWTEDNFSKIRCLCRTTSVERGLSDPYMNHSLSSLLTRFSELRSCSEAILQNGILRKLLFRFSLDNSSLYYRTRYNCNQVVRVFNRLLYPTGLSVAVIGSDGAGKTSLIMYLQKNAVGPFHRTRLYYQHPRILLKSVENPTKRQAYSATDFDNITMLSPLRSILKLVYHFAESAVGILTITYVDRVRKTLVIFDRYFFDFWYDPSRHHIAGFRTLRRLLCWLVPTPQIVFALVAPPEVIHSRKSERSVQALDQQRKLLIELGQLRPSIVFLDASEDEEQVGNKAVHHVLEYMQLQTRRNLR